MTRRIWLAPLTACLALWTAACNSDANGPNGPPPPGGANVVVLNGTSRTIQEFTTDGQTITSAGAAFTLPASYDGDAIDVSLDLFVTTSSAGIGQVIWGSLDTGEMVTTSFPGAGVADPSRATLVVDLGGNVGAVVPARARNSVYLAFPGQADAVLLAGDVGEYVVRALPFGDLLISVDANLDDVGGTLEPLGATRLEFSSFLTGGFFDELDLTGGLGATDVSLLGDDLLVLAGGTLDMNMLPVGDGNLVLVNALGRGVEHTLPLEGNGLHIEGGRDGVAYVTRTRGAGTFDSDVLSFSFSTGDWLRGPSNPIQPRDADGSDLDTCRVTSALIGGQLLCATLDPAAPNAPGRLVLMESDGAFIADVSIGAGASDISIR